MKTKMYSIYDTIAEVFNKPFAHLNNASAIRDFKQAMHDNPNKNDYSVYLIAEFSDSNGEITAITPQKIITGFDIQTPDSLVNEPTPTFLKKQAN